MDWEKIDISSLRKRINDAGYFLVFLPNHKYAVDGWVLYHRLVYEIHQKDYIPEGYVVHHVTEDKQDNRLDNLIALTNAEHTLWHKMAHKHTEETKNKMRKTRQKMKFKRNNIGRFVKRDE